MLKRQFKLTLRGESVSPESVNLDELTAIFVPFQHALEEIAKTLDIPFEHIPHFSMVGIYQGSVAVDIATSQEFERAWVDAGESIGSNQYQNMPHRAVKYLQEVYKAVSKRDLTLIIEDPQSEAFRPASISKMHPVPALPPPGKVSGLTTIHGQCVRVNGEKKDASLLMFDAAKTKVTIDGLTDQLMKYLGTRMFESVAVSGEAVWETTTWNIVSFRATDVKAFNPSTEKLFQSLADSVGEQLDSVDAINFVRDLRMGDDL